MAAKKNDTSTSANRPPFATSSGGVPGQPNRNGAPAPNFAGSGTSDAQRPSRRGTDFARTATSMPPDPEDHQGNPPWPNPSQVQGGASTRADAGSIPEGGPTTKADPGAFSRSDGAEVLGQERRPFKLR